MTDEIVDGTICTFDLETTMNNKVGKNKASAFCPDNYIVMVGTKMHKMEEAVTTRKFGKKGKPTDACLDPGGNNKVKVLVGQNIKFDLHHYRKEGKTIGKIPVVDWLKDNKIWDTQLAEYLLTGQESKYASLNGLCTKYGLPLKDNEVKEAFESGKGADTIDEAVLNKYCKEDVLNTEAVAFKQMQEAYDKKKLPFIEAMMDALMAVTDMEYNGLAIDHLRLAYTRGVLVAKEILLQSEIFSAIKDLIPELNNKDFNIDSNKQLSSIIFGGEITFEHKIKTINTKTSKVRNKIIKEVVKLKGIVDGNTFSTKNANGYKIDEEVLSKIRADIFATHTAWADVVMKILTRKKLIKELNTYYDGLSELIFPDGLLHPNINMCSTDTGRTSASEPNSQNMPSSEESGVKALFVSRWGKDGSIISVDYKQLEVVALAYLSQDKQLIKDILNGVDVHQAVGWEYYGDGHTMTDDERRVIKTVNFGLIYGGTANALAPQAGIPVSGVKNIIKAFYSRYPDVKEWQDNMIANVKSFRKYDGVSTTKNGLPAGVSKWHSETGRVYTFHEKDNPFKPGEANFKPTEIKNYPIQGFATGDLVLTMTGILWRALKNNPVLKDNCLMVNMVHDELVFDCKNEWVPTATKFIRGILENTPMYMKDIYNIDMGLPTIVKVKVGPNWKDMKVVDK